MYKVNYSIEGDTVSLFFDDYEEFYQTRAKYISLDYKLSYGYNKGYKLIMLKQEFKKYIKDLRVVFYNPNDLKD